MIYHPKTPQEAVDLRKEHAGTAVYLAGGTDDLRLGGAAGGKDLIDITGLDFNTITEKDGKICIGALCTLQDVIESDLVPSFIKEAAAFCASFAKRNSATIGGNIGNASPKGDMPQPLILMDAEVVLTSVDGERRMLVDDYIIATKKTALREDEIITKVIIPKQDFTHTFFRKIGMRRANAISKLTLSAAATVRDGVVVDFRASSGAAGPKVARSRKAEELLIGKKVSELHTCKEEFLDAWNTVISPHAMPEYRRNTTRRMLAFFIDALEAGHAPGRVDIQE